MSRIKFLRLLIQKSGSKSLKIFTLKNLRLHNKSVASLADTCSYVPFLVITLLLSMLVLVLATGSTYQLLKGQFER